MSQVSVSTWKLLDFMEPNCRFYLSLQFLANLFAIGTERCETSS